MKEDLEDTPLKLSQRGGSISINISKSLTTDIKVSPTQTPLTTPLTSPVNSPNTPNNNGITNNHTDSDILCTPNSSPVLSKGEALTPFSSPIADQGTDQIDKDNSVQKKVNRWWLNAIIQCDFSL